MAMRAWKDLDVEKFLSREARAQLPFARLCRLYLDPFALFKDATSGPEIERRQALTYNRAMRWMLIPYLRRWLLIAAMLFLGISPAQAIAAEGILLVPAAAFAIGSCIAVLVTACTAVAWVLLAMRQQ
jgi:hypothetical protein